MIICGFSKIFVRLNLWEMSQNAVFLNFEMLLRAADYIEKRGDVKQKDRALDHGYASTQPMPQQRKSKIRKSLGSRFTHNELEKNRRAHLRYCLEKLKENVPLGSTLSRHTTLGLLNRAKMLIVNLKETGGKLENMRMNELRQRDYLRRCLDQLLCGGMTYRERPKHSVSESSSSSSASSSSSPFSEQDDVDIIGSDESLEDSDDQNSNGSDESFADGARRLTLTGVL